MRNTERLSTTFITAGQGKATLHQRGKWTPGIECSCRLFCSPWQSSKNVPLAGENTSLDHVLQTIVEDGAQGGGRGREGEGGKEKKEGGVGAGCTFLASFAVISFISFTTRR